MRPTYRKHAKILSPPMPLGHRGGRDDKPPPYSPPPPQYRIADHQEFGRDSRREGPPPAMSMSRHPSFGLRGQRPVMIPPVTTETFGLRARRDPLPSNAFASSNGQALQSQNAVASGSRDIQPSNPFASGIGLGRHPRRPTTSATASSAAHSIHTPGPADQTLAAVRPREVIEILSDPDERQQPVAPAVPTLGTVRPREVIEIHSDADEQRHPVKKRKMCPAAKGKQKNATTPEIIDPEVIELTSDSDRSGGSSSKSKGKRRRLEPVTIPGSLDSACDSATTPPTTPESIGAASNFTAPPTSFAFEIFRKQPGPSAAATRVVRNKSKKSNLKRNRRVCFMPGETPPGTPPPSPTYRDMAINTSPLSTPSAPRAMVNAEAGPSNIASALHVRLSLETIPQDVMAEDAIGDESDEFELAYLASNMPKDL